jgi:hypothetical protein
MKPKRLAQSLALILFTLATNIFVTMPSARADVTWSQTSKYDTSYDGKVYVSQYDIDFSSVFIFDNETDFIYFYNEFKELPKVNMFNDGLNSFSAIYLDYNLDGKEDIALYAHNLTLKTDRSSVAGYAYDWRTEKRISCTVSVFTNLDEGSKWIGFKVSRICIGLPSTFSMSGYASYKQSGDSYDWAPYPYMSVNLLSSSGSTEGSTGVGSSGSTYTLPTNLPNSSRSVSNFSEPPKDLTKLSEELLPSVVTVRCANGSGTGWSAEVSLSSTLLSAGFNSLIVTNHHVIEDCLVSKNVTLVLSNTSSIAGKIVSWNSVTDVAGVATATKIPPLQWIGTSPKQGWWIGVLGSPLGKANVLTTGIISSINSLSKTFTLTAPINPGNSGGPVFDSTGRVLGLATSKNLLSTGELAEGFGNAHGVPLLCSVIVTCDVEKTPWGAISKFSTASNLEAEAKAKAEAEAKAKAEAEAKAKAEAEAKAKAEAEANLAYENRIKDELNKKCIAFNGDIDLAKFNLMNAKTLYPSSSAFLQSVYDNAPDYLDCDYFNVNSFDTEIQTKRKILSAYELSVNSAIATAQVNSAKKLTITCIKGKLTKKVTGINPKCPTGYRKK